MENLQDKQAILVQLNQLREANARTREGLSAIQLLMVDDNNGRVKDSNLSKQLEELSNQITEVNRKIDIFSNQLQNK